MKLNPPLPACVLMKPPSSEETLVGRLVALAGTLGSVERLVPGTRPAAGALTGVLLEDVVLRAGGRGRHAAHTPAGVPVKVPVRAAVWSLIPAPTHTLTGLHVQLLILTTHIC